MKKTSIFFVLLVLFSVLLIAGCTQTPTAVTPAPAPAVTTGPAHVVQNQGGVAIILNQTVAVTTKPTVAGQANQTAAIVTNQTVAVQANQTAPVPVNKT